MDDKLIQQMMDTVAEVLDKWIDITEDKVIITEEVI